MEPEKPRRILPAREAHQRSGVTRGVAWQLEKVDRYPRRLQITPFRVGYYEDEIDAWIASRPRGGAVTPTPKSPGRRGKRAAATKKEATAAREASETANVPRTG